MGVALLFSLFSPDFIKGEHLLDLLQGLLIAGIELQDLAIDIKGIGIVRGSVPLQLEIGFRLFQLVRNFFLLLPGD